LGGEWKYSYRAIGEAGDTIDFRLAALEAINAST
jgi:transposase-like protein